MSAPMTAPTSDPDPDDAVDPEAAVAGPSGWKRVVIGLLLGLAAGALLALLLPRRRSDVATLLPDPASDPQDPSDPFEATPEGHDDAAPR